MRTLLGKDVPFHLIALGLFIALKFFFTIASNDHLFFLLKPTDALVGVMLGSQSVYSSDAGYFHENFNILIDRSCSGYNFWILSFLVFTYLFVKYSEDLKHRILSIPLALMAGYALAIFSNTSRIFVSIIIQKKVDFIDDSHHDLLHQVIGITTNLTFLMLAYILTENILKRKFYHAKFA